MISPAIQCSFCTYFWEMYTTEFGWSMSEYGTVQTLYSLVQIGSFVIYGIIFYFVINDKDGAKGVEAGGTILHWLTYFFLIILPIKWHGVKTPYVDSLFSRTSNFRQALLVGPVALSSMATSRGWYRFFCIPWAFVKLFWVILYPFMKGFYLCIPMSHRKKNVLNITQLPGTPVDVGDIPDLGSFIDISKLPLLSVLESITLAKTNNFAMRMRRFGRWLGTKAFFIYALIFAHGIGVSMHEISSKSLESYAFQPAEVATAVPVSLTFFFGSNLLIYILFSFVKLYARSRAAFTETFYLLSIVFLVLGIPTLLGFGFGLKSTGPTLNAPTETSGYAPHWVMLGALTIFHSTIVFLIFSGGPLISYVGVFLLDGHKGLMNFGTLVLFGSLLITSFINMGSIAINDFVTNTTNQVFNQTTAHKAIVSVCIAGQFSTFLVPYAHDWSWNKNHWFNYLILVVTGIVNSIFVAYTNMMLVKLAASKWVQKNQWFHFGIFYSVTNMVVSFFMPKIFNAFGQDKIIQCSCKCFQFPYHYCFPTVYRTITGICILANATALILIWVFYTDPKLAA